MSNVPRPWTSHATHQERLWFGVFELLRSSEVVRPKANWKGETDDGVELQARVAWPEAKVAIMLSSDNSRALKADGWELFVLPDGFEEGLRQISDAVFAVRADGSARDAVNPSKPEQTMMAALLRAGLPSPDRDHQIIDPETDRHWGTPDFAWPEAKLILDLHGIYHHQGRGLDLLMKEAEGDPERKKAIRRSSTDRFEKDQAKFREFIRLGWTTLTCTDTEIVDGKADTIAQSVADMYDDLMAGEAVEPNPIAVDDSPVDAPVAAPVGVPDDYDDGFGEPVPPPGDDDADDDVAFVFEIIDDDDPPADTPVEPSQPVETPAGDSGANAPLTAEQMQAMLAED